MKITITEDLVCPRCGAEELTPETRNLHSSEWRWQIRPHKVCDEAGSWSQCLVCKDAGDPANGWFRS